MRTVLPSPLLRGALLLDAAISTAAALLHLAPGGHTAAWLGLPPALLTETGVFMLLWAAALLWLARSRTLAAPLVQALVLGNLGWALGCVAALATDLLAPTALGSAWLLLQAVAVLGFAVLQAAGLRRSAGAAGAALAQS